MSEAPRHKSHQFLRHRRESSRLTNLRYSSSALLTSSTSSFVSAYDVKSYYLTPVLGLVSHVVDTTWVNIIRTLRFNDTNRYGYLRMVLLFIPFGFIYHPSAFIRRYSYP